MKLDNVFKKTKAMVEKRQLEEESPRVPQGLLRRCNHCHRSFFAEEALNGKFICPKCGGYFRMPADKRLEDILDLDSFEAWDTEMTINNPMNYKGYQEKLLSLREKTGLDEAVVTGVGTIQGHKSVIAIWDGRFLMGSMGSMEGEKLTRAVERATMEKLPMIIFACSGGARMQEGIVSLMQMAKTSAALKRHSDAGLLYISVLTDPTTGGVTASFAMLGDIILAEPGALIGFAGPRVIEQTIGQKLPKGFQRSEFLLEHGFLDGIVKREDMRSTLAHILDLHEKSETDFHFAEEKIDTAYADKMPKSTRKVSAWERVLLSRMKDRPVSSDYVQELFEDFYELHGDRYFGDDKAIVGGIARFQGKAVTVITQDKGKDTKSNIRKNFGMPSPEGYRKALRLMKQAEKFHRPILCLVDTPGAFCGLEAEERGQGEAIARNLYEISTISVPILSIVIGEGGSGGALAMAVADEVWMLENSVYSILSPEGFASILWKDSSRAEDASEIMRLTAKDLEERNIVERVFEEPEQMDVKHFMPLIQDLKKGICSFLDHYTGMEQEKLTEHRYNRFRRM